MDPLSDVLSLLAIRGYRAGGFEMARELSIRFDAHQGIKCYAVTAGTAWLALDGKEPPVQLNAGDCFILPHGRPFRMATDLALPAQDFHSLIPDRGTGGLAVFQEGGGPQVLGSFFAFEGPGADMLLATLPSIVHLRSEEDRATLRANFARMRQELIDDRPGSALIVQQLATVTLIQALRLHLDASDGVGWLFALGDRKMATALQAIHADPARRWTVGDLASEVGMSRSSFAARFRALVGDGPIEYLGRWRMLLAVRDLARGEAVGAVSRALGYGSESAFSTAFKRVMGYSPRRQGSAPQAAGARIAA